MAHPKSELTSIDYTTARAALLAQYAQSHPTRGIRRLISKLCNLTDRTVIHVWQALVVGELAKPLQDRLCLAAVGGYGRGDLLPNSDVDVLVLLDDADLADADRTLIHTAIEKWLGALWDLGMSPGHAVRTISECVQFCHEDLATETAILEGRLLTGSPQVFEAFYAQFFAAFNVRTFRRNKVAEKNARYARFEDTPFSLEPNCKESPGGLRDLHLMLWLAKAAKIANSWQDLERIGWLNARQVKLIIKCETLLLAIRAHLHMQTRRLENRLLFDLQGGLAAAFGYQDGDGKRASERIMQRYYIAASVIAVRLNLFLQKLEDYLAPKDTTHIQHPIEGFPDFVEVNHKLDIVDAEAFDTRPELLLDMFHAYGSCAGLTGCTPKLWDAVLKYRERINPEFRRQAHNRARFIQILQMPSGITHTIRLMHQMGVLSRYIPAFRKIAGQMQHDLFHIYTVDQHILTVVRNLRRFTMQEYMNNHELPNQVMAEFGQPWLMYIAGLFHDIAKGRGGDHSSLGAVDVARFARAHALTPAQTDLVVFLVDQHLVMSQFAQKEDLTDPEVIARFAYKVQTIEHLQALYLLTVADIRGTSPKVWNAWKDKLLAQLYRSTLRLLEGQTPHKRETIIKTRQESVLAILNDRGCSTEQIQRATKLWTFFNTEYFLRHDTDTIAWHTRELTQREQMRAQLIVSEHFVMNDDENSLRLMVYTDDTPELFARICAAIGQRGYSIVSAQIYTSAHQMALDTFHIVIPDADVVDQAYLDEFNELVRLTLASDAPLRKPSLGRLSSRSRNFPIKPRLYINTSGDQDYVLKLTATDRPGVLYSIASILRDMEIQLINARVTTLGERLEDVFVLRGQKLNNPNTAAELEERILAVCTV